MFLFPEISRNVSGNFWKPFPAVSRNIFPEISRKVQFEKKSKGFSFKKFLPKANECSYAITDFGNVIKGPNYLYGHTFREFSFANENYRDVCMPVKVVWSPQRVPEVRCSVRTLIGFKQKFPLLFFSN